MPPDPYFHQEKSHMKTSHFRRRFTLLFCFVFVVGAALALSNCRQEKSAPPAKSKFDPHATLKVRQLSGQEPRFTIRVAEGDAGEAEQYAIHLEEKLGIPKNANLDSVLKFCGYEGLTGREIEITPSDQLMARFPSDLVASRFFAPKIIDVSEVGGRADTKSLGWRKIVRLRAKDGSDARAKGISAMFLLFNVFQNRTDVANDPFAPCIQDTNKCSENNQVMLIVGSPQPDSDSAYWLIFKNAAINGGERTDHLPATFDGGDYPPPPDPDGSAVRKYYLPAACAECHGGNAIHAKLNYLDSDHWNDRIQDGDDFSVIRTNSEHGVLFDGKRDTGATAFQAAFAAIKTLNKEISDQNRAAGGTDFQLRAVENWQRLHETNMNFLPPIERAIPAPTTNPNARVWSRQNPNDEALLKLLNQFCFRCHSSVRFNVFDKQVVYDKRRGIAGFVNAGLMPQDRKLDTDALRPKKEDLLRYINALR
jgi:hypothetical protein